jgi:hypothetical protein
LSLVIEGQDVLLEHPLKQADAVIASLEDQPVPETVRGPNRAEEFPVYRSDGLPVFDPRQQGTRANHLVQ